MLAAIQSYIIANYKAKNFYPQLRNATLDLMEQREERLVLIHSHRRGATVRTNGAARGEIAFIHSPGGAQPLETPPENDGT